jgi:hypothetical protein
MNVKSRPKKKEGSITPISLPEISRKVRFWFLASDSESAFSKVKIVSLLP